MNTTISHPRVSWQALRRLTAILRETIARSMHGYPRPADGHSLGGDDLDHCPPLDGEPGRRLARIVRHGHGDEPPVIVEVQDIVKAAGSKRARLDPRIEPRGRLRCSEPLSFSLRWPRRSHDHFNTHLRLSHGVSHRRGGCVQTQPCWQTSGQENGLEPIPKRWRRRGRAHFAADDPPPQQCRAVKIAAIPVAPRSLTSRAGIQEAQNRRKPKLPRGRRVDGCCCAACSHLSGILLLLQATLPMREQGRAVLQAAGLGQK